MRDRLADRARGVWTPPLEVAPSGTGELSFPDETFDFVVTTLVLCSVPDLAKALAKIHRVLRPGGRFVFIEHVAAETGSALYRWQRRLEPFWRRVAGNCHLTRRLGPALNASKLVPEWVRLERIAGTLVLTQPGLRGWARKGYAASEVA